MKKITKEKLRSKLELHKLWLENHSTGDKLDLRNANLSSADLESADLRDANLNSANLRDADLRDANLRNANLRNADLESANLRNANLRDADLRNANLRSADLESANLESANLDFTGFSLCCKSLGMTLDIEQIRQMLHLIYMQNCGDPEFSKIKSRIYPHVKRWSGLEKHNLSVEKPAGKRRM